LVSPLPSGVAIGNQANWVRSVSDPTHGYPISGTSQIIVSQCYASRGDAPSVAASVVSFLAQHYSASNVTLLHGNGFDSVPVIFVTAITDDFLTDSSTNGSNNIGNETKCGTIVGR
jgi:phosphate transport system substrate-binding protein